MRSITYAMAVGLAAIALSSGATAADPCTASLAKGTFAFTSIHFIIKEAGSTTTYEPAAESGLLYFDGVSAAQVTATTYSGTGTVRNVSASGTYTVSSFNLSMSPPGVTDVCILNITVNGTTIPYYLDTLGKSYYGVNYSTPKTIVSVQANRVS